jgi:hypothetical protein
VWGSAFAQDTGFVVDKIIAKVDNYIVLKSELETAIRLIWPKEIHNRKKLVANFSTG